ncbi:APC family permease [Yinghuangia soli]|uniref:APC family permease n=1 Tax=Yinghuangia soli TaxID=2908204 RepID=A0AA41PZD4_9ACTN|nr:APC family permease [Yinghuangia soli]MCF2527931.1 APC family permease [Yinghuangia soli]
MSHATPTRPAGSSVPRPGGPAAEPAAAPRPGRLEGALGTRSVVLMVLAAAAPLTVVGGSAPLGIAIGNGAAFPAAFAVCAAVLLLFAAGFAAMSRHVAEAGSFYSYVERGLGRAPGLGAAMLALVSYTAIQVSLYGFAGEATRMLVVDHGGPDFAWWLWAAAMLAVAGLFGFRHIELSGRVLGLLLIAEIGIVLALDAAVLLRGGEGGMSTAFARPDEFASGSPGIGIMFAIAGFIGFEATAVFRDEARDPHRTVPRATYLSLILIGVFYTVSAWAVVSAWGDRNAVERARTSPETLTADTAARYLGSWSDDAVQILMVTSMFAALLAFHNVLARYMFALGNDGVLPRALGRRHGRHGSPYAASLVQSATAAILVGACAAAGLEPIAEVFTWLGGVATLGVMLLMVLTCAAVIRFFRRTRADTRLWHTLAAPLLGLAGLLVLLIPVVANFPTLVGGSETRATVIEVVLGAAFVIGAVLSRVKPLERP